jgi:hypothetical protein
MGRFPVKGLIQIFCYMLISEEEEEEEEDVFT